MTFRATFLILALAATLTTLGEPALAHTGTGYGGGFVSGFTHPILGWDHVAAMVAVGLWGAFLGTPAIWLLPVVFPLVMALGAVLGILGIPVPAIETGIALSAVVLGLMIVLAARRRSGSRRCWSAPSRSSTAMPMAPSCRPPPMPLPSRWALSSPPACCT